MAFVVGGYGSLWHANTELLDLDTQKWQTGATYPFATEICTAPTLYHSSSFFVFGGYVSGGSHLSTIARYSPSTDKWEKLGNLQSKRTHSAAVSIPGNSFLVVGGGNAASYKTERCTLVGNVMMLQSGA